MKSHSFTNCVMTCSLALVMPTLASAQVSWTNPGTADWYNAANWSTPNVPSSANDTFVTNGGTAAANRNSPMYLTDPATNDLNVGLRTSPGLPVPIGTGTVELTDVNLDISGDLNVGVVNTPAGLFHNATGALSSVAGGNAIGDVNVNGSTAVGYVLAGPAGATATGTVDISGGLFGGDMGDLIIGETREAGTGNGTVHAAGGVSGFGIVDVGYARQPNASGNATGVLNITGGGLAGLGTNDLIVGRSGGSGDGDGTINVTGNVTNFLNVLVGHTDAGGSGAASGTLRLDDGTAMAGSMSVGVSEGDGPATGTVDLNQTLIALSGELNLGTGSSLIVRIDGLTRGSEHGAIDASTVTLGGVLDVFFESLPPLGTHHLDLIRAADSGNAIVGDFQPGGVTIHGLPALYTVSTGIVMDTINGQPNAIYRLTVNAVPEPASVLLLVLGITSVMLPPRGRASGLNRNRTPSNPDYS